MAARQHLDIMDYLQKSIKKFDFKKIDAIAATYGPGLIGGLIVGSSFAKGLSLARQKKLESHPRFFQSRKYGNNVFSFFE